MTVSIPESHYDSTALTTINYAIERRGYSSYLELGCRTDGTFGPVVCKHKVGVDSARGGTLRMTTDDYFAKYDERFDIIFVDACHKHDYVYRDVKNSLKILNTNGLVIMHDCNPYAREYERLDGGASGTVWRALVHLRTESDLDIIVGDYDHGVGVIKCKKNTDPLCDLKIMDELTYEDLDSHRSWLRLRSWESVKSWIDET